VVDRTASVAGARSPRRYPASSGESAGAPAIAPARTAGRRPARFLAGKAGPGQKAERRTPGRLRRVMCGWPRLARALDVRACAVMCGWLPAGKGFGTCVHVRSLRGRASVRGDPKSEGLDWFVVWASARKRPCAPRNGGAERAVQVYFLLRYASHLRHARWLLALRALARRCLRYARWRDAAAAATFAWGRVPWERW
jgi:hypothetical protein